MGMWRAGLVAVGICLWPGPIQSAWAQAARDDLGQLHAVSYREVPDPLSLSVSLFDDSDLDLKIQDQMVSALRSAKHSVGAEALFELELSSEIRTGGYSASDPSLGQVSSNRDNTEVQMNIWSSSQDSLLGGRQSGGSGRAASSFEIRATLRERSLGEVVWEGRAIVSSEREQADAYVPQMVAALVANLGLTARNEVFRAR